MVRSLKIGVGIMPARVPSPIEPNRPIIEPIVQPLYHRLTLLAAAPAALRYFQNTGGLNELLAFPGLLAGGQLPNPKVFVVYGYRVHEVEDVVDDALVEDMKTIRYNSWSRFFVGIKEYLTVPTFYLPSGLGIDSSGFDAGGVNTFSAASMGNRDFYCRMSIEKRKITLPPQQGFYFDVTPVGIAAGAMFADRNIYVFLDGEHGREVM
jgi:hypothetical protein